MAELDILGPSDRRRIWSAEEKVALLAEVDAERGKVRLVARRRGVSESLLYNWRSARQAAAVAAGAPEDVHFVPIGVLRGTAPREPALLAPHEPPPAPERPPAEGKARPQCSGSKIKGLDTHAWFKFNARGTICRE